MRKRSFAKAGKRPAGLLLGYARVSKGDEQTNALQARALRAAGCRRIFEEAASGGRWDRPELHRLLDHLREGDTVVVWKLDRLSRSLKDVLHIMERIRNAGAGFRSITESIDTTTPAGRMMMQMVGAFAEFERAMIRERTLAGLAAARAEGRVGGRRKKLDTARRREIAESVVSGRKSGAEIASCQLVSSPTHPSSCPFLLSGGGRHVMPIDFGTAQHPLAWPSNQSQATGRNLGRSRSGDACQLVGYGDCHQAGRSACQQGGDPRCLLRLDPGPVHQAGCAKNQKAPEIAITGFRDPAELYLAARATQFGVNPSQAANWRADWNTPISVTNAAIAVAVITPMPGIVSRRCDASFRRCHPWIERSTALIRSASAFS